ncbi:hypothetical protein PTSG_09863 [Salpingoeca rosetta]|uniref:Uncharacterized protein n=1 Tax=Salpingoeca rosetta (strain ATCC 50818 / BSB-021) TaxID=946362 RepID=F2UNC8_SALR5|nr:uncharacterized protein PTSG_09863 [Salpingoeca rosetta]EGD79133.1 hypothetical protein PTSG_09863 [Salpingoeca rosetta]|eukprot:XP_004989218.1 hypothetical protein PTSG_09863 [Salpingoeca rosetta]
MAGHGVNSVLAAIRRQQAGDVHTTSQDDYCLLDTLLNNPDFRTLLNLHTRLSKVQEQGLVPICRDASSRTSAVVDRLATLGSEHRETATSLRKFLTKPSFKAVMRAYDIIAQDDLADVTNASRTGAKVFKTRILTPQGVEALRLELEDIGEPLGCAVKSVEDSDGNRKLIVSRVFVNSFSHRSGLIYNGDEIVGINGQPAAELTSEEAHAAITESPHKLVLDIVTAEGVRRRRHPPVFMRALFDYDAEEDPWLPCVNGGLTFSKGDILEVLDQSDEEWWQARRRTDPAKTVGLIPSKRLQAKRLEAQVMHSAQPPVLNALYETVTLVQPSETFARPLVLLGPEGVGRRTIKEELVSGHPGIFAFPATHTSCKAYKSGGNPDFVFVDKRNMKRDIDRGLYIEHGRHDGDLYGIYKADVLALAQQGKTCILDIQPQSVEMVRTADVQAMVIFVQPPNLRQLRLTRQGALSESDMKEMLMAADRIMQGYGAVCDEVVVNDTLVTCIKDLLRIVTLSRTTPQWVPVSWARTRNARSQLLDRPVPAADVMEA